jgi:hypothetical protein
MRFVRILSLMALVGFCAVVARADTTIPGDPTIRADDPTCPTGAYCATIVSGPTAITVAYCNPFTLLVDPSACPNTPFNLAVADPPGFYSVPPIYTCGSNVFAEWAPTGTLSPLTFTGCNFADGTIPANTAITISAMGGPVVLDLPAGFTCSEGCSGDDIELTPEPRTWVLFITGLLLFSLAGFARKRFGAKSVA